MGNYTVIAEVGQAMTALLRRHMVPEVVSKEEQIGLCTPKESGDYRLGIYLYDIRENDAIRNQPKRWKKEEIQVYPPMYLDLYYMLLPASKSDWQYRCSEEQKLLGKAMQIIRDYPLLNLITRETEEKVTPNTIQLELQDISFEEKSTIWRSIERSIENAVYCKASYVEMESNRIRHVRRVQEVQVRFGERENTNG